MTVALSQPQTSFLVTNQAPTHAEAPIHKYQEDRDPEGKAFFEDCHQSGRPYIDYHEASRCFRYVYFNRIKPPTPKLMGRLNTLAEQFNLLHYHVLTGHILADCFGDLDSIPYQGRLSDISGEWPPEKVQWFVYRLSGLLPSFDRRAVIESMVAKAARDGYYVRCFQCPYGDMELQDDFEKAYSAWCTENGTPYVVYSAEQDYFYFDCNKTLTPDVYTRIEKLANNWGMRRPTDESEGDFLYPFRDDDPRRIPKPDFEVFARELYEFLVDSR